MGLVSQITSTEKACKYAVQVSLLEPESELYNNGIVDVSHRYPTMAAKFAELPGSSPD
jgi:hypothetical protein